MPMLLSEALLLEVPNGLAAEHAALTEPLAVGIMKELNVQYVLGYTPDEFAYSLRLIAEGQVDAASLVTATVGVDGVAAAFADLANPERHTKIIVEPWR
jgi:threonine dehydrogenase-like Zn-dependent dehydrogenase